MSCRLRPLSRSDQTVNVTGLGQSGTQSLILAGASSGDRAGFSVSDAGDVNSAHFRRLEHRRPLDRCAQSSSAAGIAYLVYGGANLAGLATVTPTERGTLP